MAVGTEATGSDIFEAERLGQGATKEKPSNVIVHLGLGSQLNCAPPRESRRTHRTWEELGFDSMSLGGSPAPSKEQAQLAAEDVNGSFV